MQQVWCEGGLCNRYGVRGSMQQVWCEGVHGMKAYPCHHHVHDICFISEPTEQYN